MKIKLSVPIEHTHEIYTSENENFDHVILLLHGFQLDGRFMYKRFAKRFGSKTKIISPNAPFMVPLKKENEWLPRYGWYFYDAQTKSFYIDYEPAAKWLSDVMKELNPQKKKTTIIGYSQGGYLAPKVAELLEEATRVVGINCVFRSNRFAVRNTVRYDQIHGKQDSIVSMEEAKMEFLQIKKAGIQGEFLETESEHLLNSDLIKKASILLGNEV